MSRPGIMVREDGETCLTVPAILRWFYEMDEHDLAETNAKARERILRVKARIDAARVAIPDTEKAIARAFDLARIDRQFAGLMARSRKHETDPSRCFVPADAFFALLDAALDSSGGSA